MISEEYPFPLILLDNPFHPMPHDDIIHNQLIEYIGQQILRFNNPFQDVILRFEIPRLLISLVY